MLTHSEIFTDPLIKMASSESKKSVIIEELVRGHQSASHLRSLLLQNPFFFHHHHSSLNLLPKILTSFTHALSLLSPPTNASSPPPYRRGRSKRRKTAQTWTVVATTIDDNHAWRKYGQKEILNFKFPRSYFRCHLKYELGCKATKQVQRIQENPEMYQITYIGCHTCTGMILSAPQAQVVTTTTSGSTSNINTEPCCADSKLMIIPNDANQLVVASSEVRPNNFTSSSSTSSTIIKQENNKETVPCVKVVPHNLDDNVVDPNLWSDLEDFELFEASIMASYTGSVL